MVEVLYMDGSSEKLTGANIKYGDPPKEVEISAKVICCSLIYRK